MIDSRAAGTSIVNALTVDVEDYYHVSAFERCVSRSDWCSYPSRVEDSTRRLLDILDTHQVTGTFFVLGWVADKCPRLVREIQRRGHELGSHSYWHRLIYHLTRDEFRSDTRQSKDVLENILGCEVTLYRAPSFSIVRESEWALEILAEEGFAVDSSVFPVRHDRYGMPEAPRDPHAYKFGELELLEFPPSTLRIGGCRLPVGGGGYFRLYPLRVTRWGIAQANRRRCPFMFYVHPWELDVQQPRMTAASWQSRARHYVNLNTTETKLHRLLDGFQFGPVSEVISSWESTECMLAGNVPECSASRVDFGSHPGSIVRPSTSAAASLAMPTSPANIAQ